ncbi:MAG: host attachment protein [Candidatus Saccharibacteria bacterium]|nr:host attachment protein [Pseudorhodobacter sp.]
MKPITTLYLLLNEETCRLLHTQGEGLGELHPAKAELGQAGGAHATGDGPKDGIERGLLAEHAAHVLANEWSKGIYDRIVISAGPKMLGEIRHELPKSLQPHIVAELHKDLIKIPLHDMMAHFSTVPAV